MAWNLPRMRRMVRRALSGRAQGLDEVCVRRWTVCPASRSLVAPALYPEGALARIQGLSPFRNWDTEQRLIEGGMQELPATVAYALRDVDVVRGHVYAGPCEWVVGVGEAPWRLSGLPKEPPIDEATLVSTSSGTHYFGCLLLDDFVLECLGHALSDGVSLPSRPSTHEADYRALLGLPPKRVVQHTRIRSMTWFVDPAHNPSKTERYRRLRANLREQIVTPGGTGLVYIRRGLAGQRRVMANEAELEQVLSEQGFTVIDPMQLPAREIARLSLDARLVVSIEGSQISHAIFSMADDARLIILQPPDRFAMQYKEFTDAMGMRCGFVVCTPGESGFTVDIPELLALIDRMQATA